ncbi:hypothetical protein [Candidatus Frankia nodulisporulans]|uniref:hypothetical protein n=1 Tax=Candidatus Frankia nodulisporulans TaxID=2060052 RepID=UPI0013D2342A|nr:hypothetical protein [Candidatus Frankia nodulisporulans]
MPIRINRTAVDRAEELAAEAETDRDNAVGGTARAVRGAALLAADARHTVIRGAYRLAGGTDR